MNRIRVRGLAAMLLALLLLEGCGGSRPVAVIEGLQLFDSLIPVTGDSVLQLYSRFEPQAFYGTYGPMLDDLSRFIERMNAQLPPHQRIDTLAIDHSIENFANAARVHRTLFLSSSYFFLFNDPEVLRSVVTHEFGHSHYAVLSPDERSDVQDVWSYFQASALFYLFRDGEYSGNARFGGHPDESPAELFASAFNLLTNREDELNARLQFVEARHYPFIERLKRLVKVHSFR